MSTCNPCSSESLSNLIQSVNCTKPPFCPPCVAEVEAALEEQILENANAIAEINSGTADSILAGWLYNS